MTHCAKSRKGKCQLTIVQEAGVKQRSDEHIPTDTRIWVCQEEVTLEAVILVTSGEQQDITFIPQFGGCGQYPNSASSVGRHGVWCVKSQNHNRLKRT